MAFIGTFTGTFICVGPFRFRAADFGPILGLVSGPNPDHFWPILGPVYKVAPIRLRLRLFSYPRPATNIVRRYIDGKGVTQYMRSRREKRAERAALHNWQNVAKESIFESFEDAAHVARQSCGPARNGPDGYRGPFGKWHSGPRLVPDWKGARVQAFVYSYNPDQGGAPRKWRFDELG